ncbi:MAG: UDP-N-acetylmuramoyl-tripeptide--D-alanyl-D-alanine ligase [Thermoanaerobaculia bacterium]
MPPLTFRDIARLTGGSVIQGVDIVASSVVIDSREVRPDSVFFAIRGDRLDGHDFLEQALATGVGAVVSAVPAEPPPGKGIVRVDDTLKALQDLARGLRESMPFLLVAITGSAGKTTTKEMIGTLIATERKTWRSWGNFNNQIGFPLCMANTPQDAEIVVSELGMSSKGEIAQMAGMTHPDVGVYTNIRPVHLEFFDSIEGIAEAKKELLDNVKPDGTLVLNADDHRVIRIAAQFPGRKITYGVDNAADFRAVAIRERGLLGSAFTLEAEGRAIPIELAMPGRHNLENLIAAIATARAVGISWGGVMRGIAEVKPAYHRGVIVHWRGATLYDDTYNSNPYALGRALMLLDRAECDGRRIAVIGDMMELGADELKFHREAGRDIPKSVAMVIGVGARAKSLLDGARDAGFDGARLVHFAKAADAVPYLRELIQPGDLVLLKGSRGIGLDTIITKLESEA